MKSLWAGVVVVLLAGCTQQYVVNPSTETEEEQAQQQPPLFRPDGQASPQVAQPPPAQASSEGGIVDTMAQGSALRAGRRAGAKIRAVSAQEQANMKEVESE